MSNVGITIKGFDELRKNIAKNPEVVRAEMANYYYRVITVLERTLSTSPWAVGSGGGGVPVRTGHLLSQSVHREFLTDTARIYTDLVSAPYGRYVHDGTSKMRARPYYDYAIDKNDKKIEDYQNTLLTNVVNKLAE